MGAKAMVERGRRAISVYGYRGSAQKAVGKLVHLTPHRPDTFDREHGTDTSRIVRLEALASVTGERARLGHKYQACDIERTLAALDRLRIRRDEFTLIDVGSGKGRVLLIAARFPFRRIIGVEFARELHDIAVANLQRVRPDDHRVELFCQDATEYEFPDEPLVLYLNNPFLPPIMRIVMERVTRSLRACPRPAYLILFAPPDVRQEAEAGGFAQIDDSLFVWRPRGGEV